MEKWSHVTNYCYKFCVDCNVFIQFYTSMPLNPCCLQAGYWNKNVNRISQQNVAVSCLPFSYKTFSSNMDDFAVILNVTESVLTLLKQLRKLIALQRGQFWLARIHRVSYIVDCCTTRMFREHQMFAIWIEYNHEIKCMWIYGIAHHHKCYYRDLICNWKICYQRILHKKIVKLICSKTIAFSSIKYSPYG